MKSCNVNNYILPSLARRVWGVGLLLFAIASLTSCNDEWQDEQYEKYISFKAPLNDNGVTAVYVPYSRHNDDGSLMFGSEGKSSYDLPVIVAGTTRNGSDINVQVGHSDTLAILNYERFGSPTYRADITDLYYKDMSDYAQYPANVTVKSGDDIANLAGLDQKLWAALS